MEVSPSSSAKFSARKTCPVSCTLRIPTFFSCTNTSSIIHRSSSQITIIQYPTLLERPVQIWRNRNFNREKGRLFTGIQSGEKTAKPRAKAENLRKSSTTDKRTAKSCALSISSKPRFTFDQRCHSVAFCFWTASPRCITYGQSR